MKESKKHKLSKKDKEKAILLGLIDLYIKTLKPIGSSYLKEKFFEFLSSATIRNYFSKLEEKGFLKQQHSSGGRIPTAQAYRLYAEECAKESGIFDKEQKTLGIKLKKETKEISSYLNESAEILSETLNLAVVLSAPKFDQDFIQNIKLIGLGKNQLICVIITDYGQIQTEIIYTTFEIEEKEIPLMEEFFLWRLNKAPRPIISSEPLLKLAQRLYNEAMLRHVAGYANFSQDLYRTGFSKLIHYSEFSDPIVLTNTLALLEEENRLRPFLKESLEKNQLLYHIGGEGALDASIISIPYRINQIPVGMIAVLGPLGIPYRKIFKTLLFTSQLISESLTNSIYKFKITYRPTKDSEKEIAKNSSRSILLEDKSLRSNNVRKPVKK